MAVLLCAALLLAPHATLLSEVRPVQLAGVLILLGVCVVGADYARARQIYAPPNERWGVWRDDPLGAARSSWFFGRSASFAELSMTRITPDNAAWVLDTSLKMLHYSPEPKVVRSLILSAHLLGRQDLVDLHSERWRAAFPTAPLPVP
jgi:O-antigen polymerase